MIFLPVIINKENLFSQIITKTHPTHTRKEVRQEERKERKKEKKRKKLMSF